MSAHSEPVSLLERIRDLEAELAQSWKQLTTDRDSTPKDRLFALEITAAEQQFLIPVDSIHEVVPMAAPEPLADSPAWVLGELVFAGHSLPVVDLALRLEQRETTPSPSDFIVIAHKPRWLALVISDFGEVISVKPSQLVSPGPEVPFAPFVLAATQRRDGRPIHLLSIGRLGRELDG
ncbi:MAG: chemotaxis protein CheW [bacterium]|nr:chemotaxis protein CheW [bacterium]